MAVKSKIITQVEDGQKEIPGKLLYPPYQTYFHSAQVAHNKQKMISSLKQVGYDVSQFHDKPASQIMNECEKQLKKTYSVKVVGIKDGELGVLSKRVEMLKKKSFKVKTGGQNQNQSPIFISQQPFQVHSTFQSKQLKTIKKSIDPQEEERKRRLLNWQAEQFEKMKGRPYEDTEQDEEALKTKKQLAHVKLHKMRKNDSPKLHEMEKNGDTLEVNAIFKQNQQPKMSYSRILEHFSDKDHIPMKNELVVTNLHKKQVEAPKLGGIIMELDEEHELYGSDLKKQTDISMKQVSQFSIPFSDQDNMHKRLKKLQDKFNSEQDNLF